MKHKLVAAAACAALLAVGIGAAAINQDRPLPHRYLQHEESQQLSDLPETDRDAASATETDPETFASHLPVISIDTHGQEIPGGPAIDADGNVMADEAGDIVPTLAADGLEYITADAKIFDAEGVANRLSDDPAIESLCQIRVRGNSSRIFDKKNYRFELVNEDGTGNDQPLFGMEASESWALQGTSIDKTMLRNYLVYNVAGEFMSTFVPEVRYFELFIDGSYCGLYAATETIKVEDGRLELNPSDPDYAATSYIVSVDAPTETPDTISDFLHYTLRLANYMEIIYPNEAAITEDQRSYIEQDISAFEKALYSYDYDTADYGYWNYIDVESFVDSYLLNEFAINDDFSARSTYLYKDARGKLTMGPPWDYDNCFDNYQAQTPAEGFYLVERAWYFMLMKDGDFCEDVIARYRELREGALSEEHLYSMIDETIAYLGPALERNWARWGYTFENDHYLSPESRRPADFAEAVDDLKEFIHERGTWLDENIENLRQYSHESAVKKFNH